MKIENVKVSRNFMLEEILFGSVMPKEAIKLAKENLTPTIVENYKSFASEIQNIRDYVNIHYESDIDAKKEITLIINAGYRPVQWEKMQGRSGDSQHTICAVDFRFGNVSYELNKEIMEEMYRIYYLKKWMGGLAIKKPTLKSFGFLHLDPRVPSVEHLKRGYGARWEYK